MLLARAPRDESEVFLKVCFVVEYYYPHVGGAEVLFQNLAEGLVRAGHSCDVVTCMLPGSLKEETVNGVRVHRVRVPRSGARHWFTFLGFFKALKYSAKADVVQTTVYNGAPPAWLAAKILRKPLSLFIFEVVGDNWRRIGLSKFMARFYGFLETIVLKLPFDAYVCISKSTLKAAAERGVPKDKLKLSYPGIDYKLFDPAKNRKKEVRKALGLQEDAFIYMFFGRPGYVKGVEHLVRAVAVIRERVPGSKLLLILSKEPAEGYAKVMTLIKESGFFKDVIVIDPVAREELPYYIGASDCVVVPSISEGFGFSCAESCAMGVPVVATTAGSLPEVASGKYVMVEPGSAEAIAQGVEKVYKKEYSVSDKKIFSWDSFVKKHIEICDALRGKG